MNYTVDYLNHLIKFAEASPDGVPVNSDLPEILNQTARNMVKQLEGEHRVSEICHSLLAYVLYYSLDIEPILLDLEQRIKETTDKINAQFTDLVSLPYHLHSVIIHRGNINSGHYWIYIYDFARRMWRKYNDGYVTEVKDANEIFETESGVRPATSSFLVYVREGKEMGMTDAVLRKISQAEENSQSTNISSDIAMLDGSDDPSDTPAKQLTRWPTWRDSGDVEMKDAAGLVREPKIENHRGVTW